MKKRIKGFKVLYKLIGLSIFETDIVDSLSQISRDNSISCGEGLWVEDGIIVTPCPIVAQTYNENYENAEVEVKKIPIFGF